MKTKLLTISILLFCVFDSKSQSNSKIRSLDSLAFLNSNNQNLFMFKRRVSSDLGKRIETFLYDSTNNKLLTAHIRHEKSADTITNTYHYFNGEAFLVRVYMNASKEPIVVCYFDRSKPLLIKKSDNYPVGRKLEVSLLLNESAKTLLIFQQNVSRSREKMGEAAQ